MVVITILLVAALAVSGIIFLAYRIFDKAKVPTEQVFKNSEAEQLMAKMVEAYKNTNTYLATVRYVQLFDANETEYDDRSQLLAFDRVDNKLRIESKDWKLVNADGSIRYESEEADRLLHIIDDALNRGKHED